MALPSQRVLLAILPSLLVVTALTCWNFFAIGKPSLSVALFFIAMTNTAFAAGDLFIRYVLGCASRFSGFSIRLLIGFLALNLLIYVLFLILPLNLGGIAMFVALVVLALWAAVLVKTGWSTAAESGLVESIFLLIVILH